MFKLKSCPAREFFCRAFQQDAFSERREQGAIFEGPDSSNARLNGIADSRDRRRLRPRPLGGRGRVKLDLLGMLVAQPHRLVHVATSEAAGDRSHLGRHR